MSRQAAPTCESCGQRLKRRTPENPLEAARLKAGFKVRGEAARALGMNREQLGKYERGVHRPGADVLSHMADVYGVTVDQLLGREPLPEEAPHA